MISQTMMKIIAPLITPGLIKDVADGIMNKALEEKSKIEIDPLNDEADAVVMFYEIGGKAFFTVAILSPENSIVRFENTQELDKLLETLFKQM